MFIDFPLKIVLLEFELLKNILVTHVNFTASNSNYKSRS